jgi:hypothetical protein
MRATKSPPRSGILGFVVAASIACLATSAPASDSAAVPATVGKPFKVSDAVTTYCAMQPPLMMCQMFAPQLAEFLAESRDAAWAAPMEKLIVKSMRVGGKQWTEIRALECRRTLCALEYAVPVDDLNHNVDGDADLDRLMEPEGGVMAPELPSGMGAGKMVSVLIWRKR